MKITRVIDGKTIEIELTPAEMHEAAEKVKENTYYSYIKNQISDLSEDDDRAILKHLDEDNLKWALDEIAIDFERLVEDCEYDWDEAWNQVSDNCAKKLADAAKRGTL